MISVIAYVQTPPSLAPSVTKHHAHNVQQEIAMPPDAVLIFPTREDELMAGDNPISRLAKQIGDQKSLQLFSPASAIKK